MKYLLLLFLLSACASAPKMRPQVVANADQGTLSTAGNPSGAGGSSADVVLIPQWHLAPNTDTVVSSANLPQGENQHAIYRQLVEWAENGSVKNVIVEGCEGEITDGFKDRFNGWTLEDLQKLSPERLDGVMTHVGLKLKAKVGSRVRVVCGDSKDLIRKHLLALSDLRGYLGFKLRIEEFAGDIKKRAEYVATVRDLMKMPADSDEIDVMAKLDENMREKFKEFNDILHQRDAFFVTKAKSLEPVEAIVIGAIHIEDLQKQLNEAHLATAKFTPKGLLGDEAELLAEIGKLLEIPTEHRAPRPLRQPVVAPTPSSTPAPQQ